MNKKLDKGITLIALIITIIVLLILAGVGVLMLAKDNGIVSKSTEAKEKTDEADEREKLQLLLLNIQTRTLEEGKNTNARDCEKLKDENDIDRIEYETDDDGSTTALITYGGKYTFVVNDQLRIIEQIPENENVERKIKINGIPGETITFSDNTSITLDDNGVAETVLTKNITSATGSISNYTKEFKLSYTTKEINIFPDGAIYWYGNDVTDITGGWELWSGDWDYNYDLTQYNYLEAYAAGGSSHFGHIYIKTKNKINLSNYSKYDVELECASWGAEAWYCGFSNQLEYGSYWKRYPCNGTFLTNQQGKVTGTIDENYKVDDTWYFFFGSYSADHRAARVRVKSIVLY